MPEHIAEDMPGRMPEDMPEDMPDRMPEDMPDKMPEDMSDRMPEDMPVTKRINVKVGITRSKVFFGIRRQGMDCWTTSVTGTPMKHGCFQTSRLDKFTDSTILYWLVVWNMNFMTFHMLGMSSSH